MLSAVMLQEKQVIEELASLIGKRIPRTEKLSYEKNGYILEGGKVTGLSVCKANFYHGVIEYLSKLENLRFLYLWNNKIKNIEPLKKLHNITQLYLGTNNIEDVSPISDFRHLKKLDIHFNKISDLSPLKKILETGLTITNDLSGYNNYISIAGNPIVNPPKEIIDRGSKSIVQWFQGGSQKDLNEVKVLLVGHGEVGKTTLVKCLCGEEPNKQETATHQIKISSHKVKYQGKQIKLKFWDFGGQEVMHSTHQFFLSNRSIYILVLDGRRDEDAEYWLKHIESFGGGSPVLVILNKMDSNPSYDVNRQFLLKKYPFIRGFYKTSCWEGSGINELKRELIISLKYVEILGQAWPKTWILVKEKLESMREDYISRETYTKICSQAGVSEEAQETLATFLNDIGVIVHFKDFALNHLHILQPQWASTAAYKIITSKRAGAANGYLKESWIKDIVNNNITNSYPSETHRYLIELMQKFELCYALGENKGYLIPGLLNIQQPSLPIQDEKVLKFYFSYDDLLPLSIMPRFIVRTHEDIYDNLQWRTGVVLKDIAGDAVAIVVADVKERRIDIKVSGNRRREYFAYIRKTFKSLHSTFEKLKVGEWIPLTDSLEDEVLAVEYRDLIGHEEAGLLEYFNGKLQKKYIVKDLLNGIEDERYRKGAFKWDVFLCHSSLDKPIVKEIIRDFKKRNITYWFDEEQIKPGDRVIQSISDGIPNCRIMLACFSKNQLSSGWCRAEYESILHKLLGNTSKQKIIPLILDNLDEDELPPFVSIYRRERFTDEIEYQRLLDFLSVNVNER